MALSDHTGNVKLMTTTVVGIVAFVALVMVYADFSAPFSGAAQLASEETWAKSVSAGELCGRCALALDQREPLPPECSQETPRGRLFQQGETKSTDHCCDRACWSVGFERCQNICSSAASDVFTGKVRYSKSPHDIPRYS